MSQGPWNTTRRRVRNRARAAVLVALGTALVAVAPRTALAQLDVDQLELVLRPGANRAASATFVVKNLDSKSVAAQLVLNDWDRAADGSNQFFPVLTVAGSCGESLRIFPASLSLAPGQAQTVRVSWASPDSTSTPTRECWAIVFVEQPPEPPSMTGTRVMLQLRTGVKVYVVPPGLKRSLTIERFDALPEPDSTGRRRVEFGIRNDGTEHLISKARIEIRRADDSLAGKVELESVYLLPGAPGVRRALLPSLPHGKYVLLLLLDYGADDVIAGQLEIQIGPP